MSNLHEIITEDEINNEPASTEGQIQVIKEEAKLREAVRYAVMNKSAKSMNKTGAPIDFENVELEFGKRLKLPGEKTVVHVKGAKYKINRNVHYRKNGSVDDYEVRESRRALDIKYNWINMTNHISSIAGFHGSELREFNKHAMSTFLIGEEKEYIERSLNLIEETKSTLLSRWRKSEKRKANAKSKRMSLHGALLLFLEDRGIEYTTKGSSGGSEYICVDREIDGKIETKEYRFADHPIGESHYNYQIDRYVDYSDSIWLRKEGDLQMVIDEWGGGDKSAIEYCDDVAGGKVAGYEFDLEAEEKGRVQTVQDKSNDGNNERR